MRDLDGFDYLAMALITAPEAVKLRRLLRGHLEKLDSAPDAPDAMAERIEEMRAFYRIAAGAEQTRIGGLANGRTISIRFREGERIERIHGTPYGNAVATEDSHIEYDRYGRPVEMVRYRFTMNPDAAFPEIVNDKREAAYFRAIE